MLLPKKDTILRESIDHIIQIKDNKSDASLYACLHVGIYACMHALHTNMINILMQPALVWHSRAKLRLRPETPWLSAGWPAIAPRRPQGSHCSGA